MEIVRGVNASQRPAFNTTQAEPAPCGRHDHNHPTNDPEPSGTGSKDGDIPYMKMMKRDGNVTSNAKFRIFTPGLSKKYHTYTEKSTRMLPEFIVRPSKK
jgi:hypothetical protein